MATRTGTGHRASRGRVARALKRGGTWTVRLGAAWTRDRLGRSITRRDPVIAMTRPSEAPGGNLQQVVSGLVH
jgi:hypothetical protein